MDVVIASARDLKSKDAAQITEGRFVFWAVRHNDIYRANVQEKLKQLEVTALLK